MQLIFDKAAADELREKYTVLELETISHEQFGTLTAWCVIPLEQVYNEIATLADSIKVHEDLVAALAENQVAEVTALCKQLIGKFGGELDTFYEVLLARIEKTGTCVHTPKITDES